MRVKVQLNAERPITAASARCADRYVYQEQDKRQRKGHRRAVGVLSERFRALGGGGTGRREVTQGRWW